MTAMRRVLVTGANGFLGRPALGALLARGFEVHGVSRTPPTAQAPQGVTFHAIDLLDHAHHAELIATVRPSHLLHLAWTVTPRQFWTDLANLDWVAASLSLTRAFVAGEGRRAVFVGSCAEYDWSHSRFDERETPLKPHTLYGASKLGLSTIIEATARQTGLSTAWGRMFFLYGPGEARRRLVSDVSAGLLASETVACTLGTQERDFMHVVDAGAALAALVDSDHQGPVNIASGRTVQVKQVVETLGRLSGRPDLLQFGARPTNEAEPLRMEAATSILRDKIGFAPQYDLEDGLAQTYDWWRGRSESGNRVIE
jgi:nucleoside-diphosphate-sugar epimerase